MKAIDLFAGAGGSSTGMAKAGWNVLWAANHWGPALEVHRLNHPETLHEQQDLQQADFRDVPEHDVLWASPSCKGHSTAASGGGRYDKRGTAPKHDWLRSTAWAAITAVEVCRPAIAVIENVEEFRRSWGLFEIWLSAWKALGYAVSENLINAKDVGVAQDRPRLFVIAIRDSKAALKLRAPRGIRPLSMNAVFDLDAGKWQPLTKAAAGVKKRVRRAIERNGFEGAFHTQSVSDNYGRSLDRPSPVVTTKHQHGLVRGSGPWYKREYRPLMLDEYKALMGFPKTYDMGRFGVSTGCALLGNAVCPPVAEWIARTITKAA